MTDDERRRDDAVDEQLAQLWASYKQQPLSKELCALVERLRVALKSSDRPA